MNPSPYPPFDSWLDEVLDLGLPSDDFVVFGSGPLLVRGWIDHVGDIDIVARAPAWERAQQLGTLEYLEQWDVFVVSIGRHITVGTRWAIGEVDTDQLIDSAEFISGLPFAPLDAVVAYKRISRRPKDLAHLDSSSGTATSERCLCGGLDHHAHALERQPLDVGSQVFGFVRSAQLSLPQPGRPVPIGDAEDSELALSAGAG